MIKLTTLPAVIIIGNLIMTSCSQSRILYCGPGKENPVVVYTKPQQHYREIAREIDVKVKSNVGVLDKIEDSNIDSQLKSKVVQLRDNLNNNSLRLNDILFRTTQAYNSNPCPAENSAAFYSIMEKATTELSKLAELEQSLNDVVASTNFADVDEVELNEIVSNYEVIDFDQ